MSALTTGKYWFILLLGILLAGSLPAQNCVSILNEAQTAFKNKNLRLAFNKLKDTETCDYKNGLLKERQTLQNNIFNAIDEQRKEAERNAQMAREGAQKVTTSEAETQKALQQAQDALDSLKVVLANLEKAKEDKVRLILADVARHQEEMNFESAVDKIETARLLLALPEQVDRAFQDLNRVLLRNARENLREKNYRGALSKLQGAKELNVQPDSVAIIDRQLRLFLFENIQLDMLNTDYDSAALKLYALHNLQGPEDTIQNLYFDLAFCCSEVGRFSTASFMLDAMIKMRDKHAIPMLQAAVFDSKPAQSLLLLREARQQINPVRNEILLKRYFPRVSEKIPQGVLILESDRRNSRKDTCRVTIPAFLMAAKEITFYEYDLFCVANKRTKPFDKGWGRGDKPVVDVTWYDAIDYCNWRSRVEGLQEVYKKDSLVQRTGDGRGKILDSTISIIISRYNSPANGYRLPSEIEWQYAAGNGEKQTRFAWGNDYPSARTGDNVSDETARIQFPEWKTFEGYSDGFAYTAPVGSFRPNDFGLYDMSGNVWEWCEGYYRENNCGDVEEQKISHEADRNLRGGSWGSFPKDCEVGNRFHNQPYTRNFSIGFRLSRNQN